MTKKKNPEDKLKVGRPTGYKPEFCEIAANAAIRGATDREIADLLEIDVASLYRYKHSHPEFCEAMRVGKEMCDQRVEASLYHRAVGYSFDAVKIMQDKGRPVIVSYVEHVPPDVGAMTMWLKNRKPTVWRDKIDVEHTTADEILEMIREARERVANASANNANDSVNQLPAIEHERHSD